MILYQLKKKTTAIQGRIQTLWKEGVPARVLQKKGVGVLEHYLTFFVNFTHENDKFSSKKKGCQPPALPPPLGSATAHCYL